MNFFVCVETRNVDTFAKYSNAMRADLTHGLIYPGAHLLFSWRSGNETSY